MENARISSAWSPYTENTLYFQRQEPVYWKHASDFQHPEPVYWKHASYISEKIFSGRDDADDGDDAEKNFPGRADQDPTARAGMKYPVRGTPHSDLRALKRSSADA